MVYLLAVDTERNLLFEVHHVVGKIEGKFSFGSRRVMFAVLDGDAPMGLTLGGLVGHALYGKLYDIVLDGHFVTGAFVARGSVALVHSDILEAAAVDTVHRIVFPHEVFGIHHTGEVAEPRCHGGVVDAMPTTGDELYAMTIFCRVASL